jgi:hypothetical protein
MQDSPVDGVLYCVPADATPAQFGAMVALCAPHMTQRGVVVAVPAPGAPDLLNHMYEAYAAGWRIVHKLSWRTGGAIAHIRTPLRSSTPQALRTEHTYAYVLARTFDFATNAQRIGGTPYYTVATARLVLPPGSASDRHAAALHELVSRYWPSGSAVLVPRLEARGPDADALRACWCDVHVLCTDGTTAGPMPLDLLPPIDTRALIECEL